MWVGQKDVLSVGATVAMSVDEMDEMLAGERVDWRVEWMAAMWVGYVVYQ